MTEAAELSPPAPKTAPPAFASRRTFAIISHPDAGKTTLTEQLLLAGGAIHLAGRIRSKGGGRATRSDWMEIEQKRGISVTSSVMTFERGPITYNLLDTPGHADFSEDTYRTLTAVDSAVMVLDAAKGIEAQTRKLFEVCRLRDIPIITFINKVDREGLDPLALMDEIADTLALDVTPVTWPIGMGVDYRGFLDLIRGRMILPDGSEGPLTFREPEDIVLPPELADDPIFVQAVEALTLARAVLPRFDIEAFRAGMLTPVFFGSALKGLGVPELLDGIATWSPPPQPQPAEPAPIRPDQNEVTGFVFKVQANMDPNHRDRVAFMRLCSGTFRRGMKLRHVRTGKDLTISNPVLFMARDRETADEAVAGDIVGVPNHGTLSVGDTLTERSTVNFTGIPDFAPEILRRVRPVDVMRSKQLSNGLHDLAEEGVAQMFKPHIGNAWIVGVIGDLQLEVLASRLASEYGTEITMEPSGADSARWVAADDGLKLKAFVAANRSSVAEDRAGAPVYLAPNRWTLERTQKDWPDIRFLATRERAHTLA